MGIHEVTEITKPPTSYGKKIAFFGRKIRECKDEGPMCKT
jgi:hypothetical protein